MYYVLYYTRKNAAPRWHVYSTEGMAFRNFNSITKPPQKNDRNPVTRAVVRAWGDDGQFSHQIDCWEAEKPHTFKLYFRYCGVQYPLPVRSVKEGFKCASHLDDVTDLYVQEFDGNGKPIEKHYQ